MPILNRGNGKDDRCQDHRRFNGGEKYGGSMLASKGIGAVQVRNTHLEHICGCGAKSSVV
jgi:predicted TPR repeat methyltransferase